MIRHFVFVFLILCSKTFLYSQDFNIADFGAKPDGTTLNTTFIQSAIDAAHQKGRGRVVVPAGQFLTGSIILKSGVELHLQDNAVLLGSTDPADYKGLNRWKALVLADHQTYISITGEGEIDGQGRKLALHIDSLFYAGKIDSAFYNFVEKRPSHLIRPQLIEFVQCKDIDIRNVTLRNASCWVQTYDQCERIRIDSIRVESDAYWNNDGIDIQDCHNVRITHCFVNAADDGICLKSQSPDYLCDSIYISDCIVRSSASAIKFGTVSHGGFRNVVIKRIKVYDTFRSAIAIECVDGGTLSQILVDSIEAVNTGNAFFIRLGDRNASRGKSELSDVILRNIKVQVAFERPDYAYEIRGPELPFFHNTFPASITGLKGMKVKNVLLENIEVNYPGRGNNGLANLPLSRLDQIPEKPVDYPEFSMFGELPAWGLYVRHVEGLVMRNIKFSIDAPDYRPCIVLDDVSPVAIDQVSIRGDHKPKPIILHNKDGARGKVTIDCKDAVLKM